MKRLMPALLALLLLASCSGAQHTCAYPPLVGNWSGLLPAADCPGVEYFINFYPDTTYTLVTNYIDGEGDGVDIKFESQGSIKLWTQDGVNYMQLLPPPGNDTVNFIVEGKGSVLLLNNRMEKPSNESLYRIKKMK